MKQHYKYSTPSTNLILLPVYRNILIEGLKKEKEKE